MAWFMISVVSGLVVLSGVSIYSALALAKKTDELLEKMEREEEISAPFVVRFPDSVFQAKRIDYVKKEQSINL